MKQKLKFNNRPLMILFCAAAIFLTVVLSSTLIPVYSLYPDTLEEELERVKKERENTKKEIEKTSEAEAEYTTQVNQLESKLLVSLSELDGVKEKLYEIKTEVDRLTIELVIKEEELAGLENTLKEKKEILNSRIAEIYKNRDKDLIQLLFETDHFLEFFSNFKLMNMLARQDKAIVDEFKEARDDTLNAKDSIAGLKEEEKTQKKQAEILESEAEKKKREIEDLYLDKQELLRETRENKEELLKMEKQLAAKENEITKKLEALRYGNAPGRLAYPVRGLLTSGFGNRISPITGTNRFHGGVDIGAASGTPVIAASGGEVLQADYMGGYGYAILIYHGGGFATFYAHLSGFAVSAGQKVKQGQIIGYVGSTGFTTGPHLHFEVRINGAQKNPYSYF